MKTRKIILLVCILLLPLSVAFCYRTGKSESCAARERVTVLCVGLDEAAENTDVLMLITVDPEKREITVLQIPRDTYFSADTIQSKINQLYPAYRLAGRESGSAMVQLTSVLSGALGSPIDYYVALDFSSIAYFVDRLGGLCVNVPSDALYGEGSGSNAEVRTLNGEEALAFVRYRAGYAEGDLARVDAQKLLLISAYKKLKNELSLGDLLSLIPDLYKRIVTNMTLSSQLSLAYTFVRDRTEYTVRLVTLPGEATRADETLGTWYYIPNKKAATEVLSRYFGTSGFDPYGRMTDNGRAHFVSIYERNDFSYRIYSEETIDELKIKSND